MGITLNPMSTQLVLPVWSSRVNYAGPVSGHGAGGSSLSERPRTNECVIRLQPSTDAVMGISVSAAQGSQKPVFATAGTQASGVPPRSRPV
jgi:hypothetical protein